MAEQSVEDRLAAEKVRVQKELILVNQLVEEVLANPRREPIPGRSPYIPVTAWDVENAYSELIKYLKRYVRIATGVNAEKIP